MSENEKTIEIDSEESQIPDNVKGQIYLITNTVNDKKYVGQTRTHIWNHEKYRDFGYVKRFNAHISEAIRNVKKNQCARLNASIRKHGADAFKVELIMDNCELKELDALEAKYIDEYESLHTSGKGYNLTKGGQFTARTTEASRKKISETVKTMFQNKDIQEKYSKSQWRNSDEKKIQRLIEYNITHVNVVLQGDDQFVKIVVHCYSDETRVMDLQFAGKHVSTDMCIPRVAYVLTQWRDYDLDSETEISIDKRICKRYDIETIDDIVIPEDLYPVNVKEIKPRERSDTYKRTNIQDREERFNDMEITAIDIAVRTVKGYQVITFNIFEYNNPKKHQCTFGGKHGTFEEWCGYALEFMIYLYTCAIVDPNTVNIIGKLKIYINNCDENHALRKLLTCYEKLWL